MTKAKETFLSLANLLRQHDEFDPRVARLSRSVCTECGQRGGHFNGCPEGGSEDEPETLNEIEP